jgi:uncharacterized coiled-coil protein SlyX
MEPAIEELQAKIAYLERAVSELSDVAFRQHKEIEALEVQVKSIRLRLQAAAQDTDADAAEARTAEEERPPHY